MRRLLCAAMVAMVACSPDPAVVDARVLTFEGEGEDVTLDEEFVGRLSSPDGAVVQRPLVVAAACHNLLAWVADLAIDNLIVVSSRPEYARVGEMVEDGLVEAETAARFERALLAGAADADGDPEFETYLELRSQRPARDSLDRYVAYVTNTKLTEWRFVLVDTERFSAGEFGFAQSQRDVTRPLVAGEGPVEVTTSQCDQFVDTDRG